MSPCGSFLFNLVVHSKRSTLTNLLESISDWTVSLENKLVNRAAYISGYRIF